MDCSLITGWTEELLLLERISFLLHFHFHGTMPGIVLVNKVKSCFVNEMSSFKESIWLVPKALFCFYPWLAPLNSLAPFILSFMDNSIKFVYIILYQVFCDLDILAWSQTPPALLQHRHSCYVLLLFLLVPRKITKYNLCLLPLMYWMLTMRLLCFSMPSNTKCIYVHIMLLIYCLCEKCKYFFLWYVQWEWDGGCTRIWRKL